MELLLIGPSSERPWKKYLNALECI